MQPTKLLCLEDFTLLTTDATVLDVFEEEGKTVVVLDQTVFYPQGGGQPYDTGVITGPSGSFAVEAVHFVDGIVKHIGSMGNGTVSSGEAVHCVVDAERRQLHSRLHSAAHVITMGVYRLGLPWTPGKGYHFPQGSYVEYGAPAVSDKEKIKSDLEQACNDCVAEDRLTTIRFMPKEKMHEVCLHVPDNLPEGKPARVVMYGDFGVPCGGTHVTHLGEIGHIAIRKMRGDGGVIRVSYEIS